MDSNLSPEEIINKLEQQIDDMKELNGKVYQKLDNNLRVLLREREKMWVDIDRYHKLVKYLRHTGLLVADVDKDQNYYWMLLAPAAVDATRPLTVGRTKESVIDPLP